MRGSNSPEPTAHALISRRCVNNCIFCTVARQRSERKFPGKAEILRFIKERAASGTRFLVFSGLGEPTLDPHFEEYLAEAGSLGFDRITLFTNGYGLTLAKARGWKKLGLTGVLVSLHGTEAGHDRVVQRKGSFREAVRALKIYVRLGLDVSVNTCLTRHSLPDIPALRAFLAGYPLTNHTLAFPEWLGNAPLFAESLLNYEEVSEAAGELLPTPDRVTFFNNIPYCLVQKPTIESETAPHTVRLLAGGGERIIHQGQGKRFLPACSAQPCPLLPTCPGFDRNYLAVRGWGQIREKVASFLDSLSTMGSGQPKSTSSGTTTARGRYPQRQAKSCDGGRLVAIIKPTFRCNAGCLYCSSRSRRSASGPDMTLDLVLRMYGEVLEYAHQEGITDITFLWHGGEPMLLGKSFYVRAWEKTPREKGIHLRHIMQTNLLLLDREWAELCQRFGVNLGTSVDPIGKERVLKDGSPQYPVWLKKLFLAWEAGLQVGVVFTATIEHLTRAPQVYYFFKNLQAIAPKGLGIRINPVTHYAVPGTSKQLMPPKAFGDFLYQIWQLWRGEGRPFAIHPFEEWDRGGSTNCQLSGTCAQHLLALDNRGNIFQCGRFAELGDPEGNLQEEPLVKILRNPRRLELSQRSSILKAGHCRGCLYWEACHGGCPHHAYLHSGNAMTPTPFCQAIKTFFHQVSEGVAASPEKERENC